MDQMMSQKKDQDACEGQSKGMKAPLRGALRRMPAPLLSRKGIIGSLLASLSILVTLGLAEGLLRLMPDLLPQEAHHMLEWRGLFLRRTTSIAHPYIGFIYPANFHGTVERKDFRFTYRTDGLGFRNPGPWPKQAEIVAVGDSMTFGYGVEDDQAWTALLSRQLIRSRIINLGLVGAAPQQYLRIYETFGIDLQPKILLFGLHPATDLGDANTFDLWIRAGGEGNYDVWRFFGGTIRGTPQRIRSFIGRSYLYSLLEAWNQHRSLHLFQGRTLGFPDGSRLQLTPSFLVSIAASARPDHPSFLLVLQTIEHAQRLAQERAAKLLVLLFPTREEVYLPLLSEPCPDLIGPFRAELEKQRISYLDLTPAFRQRAKAGERLFLEVDGHPNTNGYALIADVILAHLRDKATTYGLTEWETPTQ